MVWTCTEKHRGQGAARIERGRVVKSSPAILYLEVALKPISLPHRCALHISRASRKSSPPPHVATKYRYSNSRGHHATGFEAPTSSQPDQPSTISMPYHAMPSIRPNQASKQTSAIEAQRSAAHHIPASLHLQST
ncbi:hypothetical protein K491DRAFT_265411 [Lophiostoma macrostomum CBS 122681]|uniref:Uncharacterized protein n=1 Tax=Lophiostoma macrostomum CBS 122681 TaxID=1314788 RepID=A0A6A6SNP7_9PLEO|nr:hypothetical protein K491DRAFT_265411 [Lophiostoma macrostomum CBS 122681]